jgi:hypothetical protein
VQPANIPFDPAALTYGEVLNYAERATSDPVVASLVGSRFAFCYRQSIEPADKSVAQDERVMQLIFFSYTRGKTVSVLSDHGRVVSASDMNSWPHECRGEVDAAVALARADERLAGRVASLRGGGMLYQHLDDQRYPQSHRIMDIKFINPGDISQFGAIVDLTEQKVLHVEDLRQ